MKTKRTKRLRIAASLILAAVMIISCIGVYAPGGGEGGDDYA